MKLILSLLIINSFVFSQIDQKQIDSLTKIANSKSPDSVRISALSDLNWIFAVSNPKKSKEYAIQEIQLSANASPLLKAQAYNDLAISFYKLTINDSALYYNKKAYDIRKAVGRKDLMASSLSKIAMIHMDLGNYSQALIANLEALNIYEQKKDEARLALIYNNISQLYEKLNRFDKEIYYCEKSLNLCIKLGDEYGEANCLANLAGCYIKKGNAKKSFAIMDRVIAVYSKYGDSLSLSSAYNNLGYMNRITGDFKSAKDYYLKAIAICKNLNNTQSLLLFLHNLSSIYLLEKNYLAAESTSKEVLSNTSADNITQLLLTYRLLATIYPYLNKPAEAEKYLDNFVSLKDSVFSKENAASMGRLQTLFEIEKQDLMIQNLEKDKVLQSVQIKKRNTTILAVTIGLGLSILLIFAVFRSYRQKQKANSIITLQKEKVESQRDELKFKNEIIEEKSKEITDSINYAKRIQDAILPSISDINKHFPNNFVYYQPKDIIAGDFYWMHSDDNLLFIAAADSTGHGVPGAMVSIVCSNALDKAVKDFGLTKPGEILDKTTDLVIESFAKNGQIIKGEMGEEIKDGMDISLLCIDKQNKKIFWSGANNQLWFITPETKVTDENSESIEISEIKPDKQPIGKNEYRKAFVTHEIQYLKGTIFYLMTDGYPDQFGGAKGKKFKYKQLAEILIENYKQPLEKQKETLLNKFEAWKVGHEQVDDVTIIGIQI
ncbi:MAG: tetratricopeptide repeat protein [Bacteroidota bacterium]|nr:tetratricopeptide repeat protein [Bacteroidota bacterium]MDP3146102.1 tetratricopeptide repeat protein [Bacteroidota bacterium]